MNAAKPIPITRQAAPLRQQVLDRVRGEIIAGRLAEGKRLKERELCQMTGVSRTVIREVLRQLESEGLIEIEPNRGPVVRTLSINEARDLYRIRGALEGLAARLFVENAGAELIDELEERLMAVTRAYIADDVERIMAAKTVFYDTLYKGALSEVLGTTLATVHARIWRWRAMGLSHPQRSPTRAIESVENLTSIVAAIAKGDADEAERLTRYEASRASSEVMKLLILDENQEKPGDQK